jgi:hypothetical protein
MIYRHYVEGARENFAALHELASIMKQLQAELAKAAEASVNVSSAMAESGQRLKRFPSP